MGIRLKLFFAQLFLLISSTSTEQSQICVMNTESAKQERRDFWQDNLTHCEPAKLLIMTPRPSTETPAQENLLQEYHERVERLSQQNRVIKICTDAGFLKTVEVEQYFMTKHTDDFLQFAEPVTCREYTLPRDEKSTEPERFDSREHPKLDSYWKFTTSYLQGKYGVGIRIDSANKGNPHSWVRISHRLKKLVTELSNNKEQVDNNEQETSEMQFEEFALKTNVLAFCEQIKG